MVRGMGWGEGGYGGSEGVKLIYGTIRDDLSGSAQSPLKRKAGEMGERDGDRQSEIERDNSIK